MPSFSTSKNDTFACPLNYNITMIPRLFSGRLATFLFSSVPPLTRAGGMMVSELPQMELPVKPKLEEEQPDDRLSAREAYKLFSTDGAS